MNSYETGAVSELTATLFYLRQGHQPFLPAIRNGPVDLIVDKGASLHRVQVKTGTWVTSGPFRYLQARIRSANGKLHAQSGHYDTVMVVHGDEIWEIPASAIFSTNICLRGDRPGRGPEAWDAYKVQ